MDRDSHKHTHIYVYMFIYTHILHCIALENFLKSTFIIASRIMKYLEIYLTTGIQDIYGKSYGTKLRDIKLK